MRDLVSSFLATSLAEVDRYEVPRRSLPAMGSWHCSVPLWPRKVDTQHESTGSVSGDLRFGQSFFSISRMRCGASGNRRSKAR